MIVWLTFSASLHLPVRIGAVEVFEDMAEGGSGILKCVIGIVK